jgi:uncharacterized membrane protein
MMQAVIFTLILIAILVSIASGVWVAIALVKAISTRQHMAALPPDANQKRATEPPADRPKSW